MAQNFAKSRDVMGFFDRFRKKSADADDEDDELADDEEWDWEDEPADAIAIVREGHNVPTEAEMREVLAVEAPECVDLPKTGLNQMRWWKEEGWVGGGMHGIAKALRHEYEIDLDKTTWKVSRDDRGARVGIVFMRK